MAEQSIGSSAMLRCIFLGSLLFCVGKFKGLHPVFRS